MASGIPLVTTRVGMAEDIGINDENSLLSDVGDVDALASSVGRLADDVELREKLAVHGRLTAESYDWDSIGRRYANEVYRPLLNGEY